MEDYATKYKTADNQQDIILRRRQKVIAVFEKDMVTTIEAGQMLYAKRFVDNLKKSEALLKKHESTKTILFTRRRNESRGQTDGRKEVPRNVANATQKEKNTRTSQAEFQEQETRKRTRNSVSINRSFSAKLREVNKNMNVPYVKLSSYTRDDLKRPATSLELKRKVWEDMTNRLQQSREAHRPSRTDVAEKYAMNVPRSVQEAREKLRAFTKLRFPSQLAPSPPRIDVDRLQSQRREHEGIERDVVRQFCDSLEPLRTVLPESFRLMDVNEVHAKNAEIQGQRNEREKRNEREGRERVKSWLKDKDIVRTKHQDSTCSRMYYNRRHSHPFSN